MNRPALFLPLAIASAALAQTTEPTTRPQPDRLITGASLVQPDATDLRSKLELTSSDQQLVDVFNWARTQAMDYAFDDGDPVGPWYEAVEPGREGFCIRDTCHQSMGAHALGLDRYTHNMLHRFAENVRESRDWCATWEINRFNHPAPVDYKNDAEFWYNLPANFDLVDCCYRMYVWSGDESYVNDPVFLNLYDRTVNDYVERWGLSLDQIMTRPRLLNVRGIFNPKDKFQPCRGIPGYNEGDHTYIISFDVIATQYAAYQAYANLQACRGDADLYDKFMQKAADLKDMADKTWWNPDTKSFYSRLNKDYQLEGGGGNDPRQTGSINWDTIHYDDPDADTAKVENLKGARVEYPEVSFTRIGTIVNGTMGINIVFSNTLLSAVQGSWVEAAIRTCPGIGSQVAWAELKNLPIRSNTVTVRHDGMTKTTFTNQHGPALIWLASFRGDYPRLLVNGKPAKAKPDKDDDGNDISYVRIAVGAGGTVVVSVPQ